MTTNLKASLAALNIQLAGAVSLVIVDTDIGYLNSQLANAESLVTRRQRNCKPTIRIETAR